VIDPSRVKVIFSDCIWESEGLIDPDKNIEVAGILHTFGFNKDKVEEHREEITKCLDQLPDEFKKSGGGGWTFLNACNTKDGEQWTGLHLVMEQLFCLGMAIDLVKYTLPREMWSIFPGSMPYMIIDL
jgi:hypothetical protein